MGEAHRDTREPGPSEVTEWRVPTGIRASAVAVFVLFVVVAALLTVFGIVFVGALLVWLIALSVTLFVWRWYLVPYVSMTTDRLEVQGPITHWSVPWTAITGARPGVLGLRIDTVGGEEIPAWAIQKSALSEWLHRPSRADEVVSAIMARAGAAVGVTPPR